MARTMQLSGRDQPTASALARHIAALRSEIFQVESSTPHFGPMLERLANSDAATRTMRLRSLAG